MTQQARTRRFSPCRAWPSLIGVATIAIATLAAFSIASADRAETAASTVIAIDADVSTGGIQASAEYPAYAPSVSVDVVVQDALATGAFEFDVLYSPDELAFLGWSEGLFLASTGRLTSCYEIVNETDVRVGCSSDGPAPPAGPDGGGVLATLRFRPKGAGESCLLLLLVETASEDGDPIPTSPQNACVNFSPDSDGDGCADMLELSDDPSRGGGRDPFNAWDFFDVTGDRRIDLSDTLLILEHFGEEPGDDAFDPRLDRYLPDASAPYRPAKAATPSTGVDLIDALVNLASFGHSCAAPS